MTNLKPSGPAETLENLCGYLTDAAKVLPTTPRHVLTDARVGVEVMMRGLLETRTGKSHSKDAIEQMRAKLKRAGVRLPEGITRHVDTVQRWGNASLHGRARVPTPGDVTVLAVAFAEIALWYAGSVAADCPNEAAAVQRAAESLKAAAAEAIRADAPARPSTTKHTVTTENAVAAAGSAPATHADSLSLDATVAGGPSKRPTAHWAFLTGAALVVGIGLAALSDTGRPFFEQVRSMITASGVLPTAVPSVTPPDHQGNAPTASDVATSSGDTNVEVLTGRLRVRVLSGGPVSVFVDGERIASGVSNHARWAVDAGMRVVTVQNRAGAEREFRVRIAPDATEEIEVRF